MSLSNTWETTNKSKQKTRLVCLLKLTDLWEIGQDGGVERPWAHLLTRSHQNHKHLQNCQQWKTGTYKGKKKTTTEDKLYTSRRQVGRVDWWYSQVPYFWVGDPQIRVTTLQTNKPLFFFFAICINMDGLGGHCAKWNKSEKGKQCMGSLKCSIYGTN